MIAASTHAQFVNAFAAYGSYNAVINAANTSGAFPTVSSWNQLGPSLLGVGFASETLIFFQYSSYVGGEIRNARKAAPVALIGALAILVGFVLLMAWGFTNTIGDQFLGAIYALFYTGSASYPLSVPPSLVFFAGILAGHNQPLLNLMGVRITAWSLAIVPFLYLTMSRNVMASSFDRILPERFSRVSPRFHSPTYAILFAFVLSQLFLIPYTYAAQFVQFFAAMDRGSRDRLLHRLDRRDLLPASGRTSTRTRASRTRRSARSRSSRSSARLRRSSSPFCSTDSSPSRGS